MASLLKKFYEPAAFPLLAAVFFSAGGGIAFGIYELRASDLRSKAHSSAYSWETMDPEAGPRKLYVSEALKNTTKIDVPKF